MADEVVFNFSNGDLFDPLKIEIVGNQAQLVLNGSYPTDNPTITSFNTIPVATLKMANLILFQEGNNVEKPTGTDIRYVIKDSDIFRWYDGSKWTKTDGNTFAETNTSQEIDAQRTTMTIITGFQIVAFLNSDGSATPKL